MRNARRAIAPILIFVTATMAQSNIQGQAIVSLVDAGTDCGGYAVVVEIHADVSGMTGGQGQWVGLNGYELHLDLDRTQVFASAATGYEPQMDWSLRHTSKAALGNRLSLVGWWPSVQAPNQSYHLVRLLFAGRQGPLTIMPGLDTQLASRVAGVDNGPDEVPYIQPPPLTVTIPLDFALDLDTAVSLWRTTGGVYDLYAAPGIIDTRDLIKLLLCTP